MDSFVLLCIRALGNHLIHMISSVQGSFTLRNTAATYSILHEHYSRAILYPTHYSMLTAKRVKAV